MRKARPSSLHRVTSGVNLSSMRLSSAAVLFVAVFLDREFFRVCVVARIDADHLNPLGRLQSRFRLEVDVRDDRG